MVKKWDRYYRDWKTVWGYRSETPIYVDRCTITRVMVRNGVRYVRVHFDYVNPQGQDIRTFTERDFLEDGFEPEPKPKIGSRWWEKRDITRHKERYPRTMYVALYDGPLGICLAKTPRFGSVCDVFRMSLASFYAIYEPAE